MNNKDKITRAFTGLKAPSDTLDRVHEKTNAAHTQGDFLHRKRFILILSAVLVLALGTTAVYAVKIFKLNSTLSPEPETKFFISLPFEGVSPITQTKHTGIDYAVETGTPVLASADGEVTAAEFNIQKGNHIVITHEDGYTTLYAHMEELYVSAGDMVKSGDEIGTSGNTGASTGPHLHFEVQKDGIPVNPDDYLQ